MGGMELDLCLHLISICDFNCPAVLEVYTVSKQSHDVSLACLCGAFYFARANRMSRLATLHGLQVPAMSEVLNTVLLHKDTHPVLLQWLYLSLRQCFATYTREGV